MTCGYAYADDDFIDVMQGGLRENSILNATTTMTLTQLRSYLMRFKTGNCISTNEHFTEKEASNH